MRINRIIMLVVFLVHCFFAYSYGKAVFVHNSMKEIEACKGKLKLKLIRTWGGEEEQEENKFFNTPRDVVVDVNNSVYICDQFTHCVKVFDSSGKYLSTIGRIGKGPGDLLQPTSIALAPGGNLWVCEYSGMRVQCFNPAGKSIGSIKESVGKVMCFMEMTYCGKAWKNSEKAPEFSHTLHTILGKAKKKLSHIPTKPCASDH